MRVTKVKQKAQDNADIVQPYDKYGRVNPEFIKIYGEEGLRKFKSTEHVGKAVIDQIHEEEERSLHKGERKYY